MRLQKLNSKIYIILTIIIRMEAVYEKISSDEISVIIAGIKEAGRDEIANRLQAVYNEIVSRQDNSENISLLSLQSFASFLISHPELLKPRIGLNPSGLVQAVWGDKPKLVVNFLESGQINYAYTGNPRASGIGLTHEILQLRHFEAA